MSQSNSSKKVVWILATLGAVGLFAFLILPVALFVWIFSFPDFFGGTLDPGLEVGEAWASW